jgi:hypothetical protein
MAQFTISELQEKRKMYWKELQNITIMLRGLEETLKEVRIQHKEALDNYSRTDYELALVDGRAQKVSEQSSGPERSVWKKRSVEKKVSTVDDLTQEQIDELLMELDPESLKIVPLPEEIDQNELVNEENENEEELTND